jgi:hypothetical protein
MQQLVEFFAHADPLALYGALTGTFALLFGAINAFNAFFDRPFLRISARIHQDRTVPHKRSVVVTLRNVGRRKARCYVPELCVADRKLKRLLAKLPDELWDDSHGWYPNESRDHGVMPQVLTMDEYASEVYSFDLHEGYRPLWVAVFDTLQRRTRRIFLFGRTRSTFYGLVFALYRWRGKKS